jgi:dynein heavy chain 1
MTVLAALRDMPESHLVCLNFSSSTKPDLVHKTLQHYCETCRTPSGVVMRPRLAGKWLIIMCDEVNLPATDNYGTQHVISLLRQLIEQRGFWRQSDTQWIMLERVQIVCACNPPGDEGRVALPPRFLIHTTLLYLGTPTATSLRIIYGAFARALLRLAPSLRAYDKALSDAMVHLYCACSNQFTRDVHQHYIFSPRDLSRWMRALHEALSHHDSPTIETMLQLLVHEGLRLFQDKLVTREERSWVSSAVQEMIRDFFPHMSFQDVEREPLIFCSWLTKAYARVERHALREFVAARLKTFYEEELNGCLP